MLPSQRQAQILERLAGADSLALTDLTRLFDVSLETIRRDVAALHAEGRIVKIYGGVKLKEAPDGEPPMEARSRSRRAQKQAIAAACCALIEEGDSVFLDSGSTILPIARLLKDRTNLTVVTNSIPVVNELLSSPLEVILIGGRLRHEEASVVTFDYLFDFTQLNIQKCFIGVGGITLDQGLSDYHMGEAATRRRILERSRQVFAAADSTKIGRDVTVRVAALEDIDALITDQEAPAEFQAAFPRGKCRLILAEARTAASGPEPSMPG